MMVQKSVAREMLARIEQRIEGGGNWAWKIMRSLPKAGDNLFSEFETYGHFVKNHHPGRVAFEERPWLREGTQRVGGGIPAREDLQSFAREFDFVSFERASTAWRRLAKLIRARLGSPTR